MSVRREQEGPVSVVTVDRPDRMNSFDLDAARQLSEAVQSAMDATDTGAVLVGSTGERAFCTGADLQAFRAALEKDRAREVVREVSTTMNEVIRRLARGEKPAVAAVDGVAAGGGLGLALACDVRVASRRARFTPAFLDVGVSPDGGSTWFLPRIVGEARARDMILRNRTLDADEALDWGLVTELADEAPIQERGLEVARELAEGPRQATAWAKDRLSHQHDLSEHLNYESKATARSAETEDFRTGIEAFLEGREPDFE